MNLRIPVAEQPISCAVIHEKDVDKITLGSMRIKTWYHDFGENLDEQVNLFLDETPKYVLNISQQGSLDGLKLLTRVVYREILKIPPKPRKEESNANI